MSFIHQVEALLWKNFILRRRYWYLTLLVLLCPVAFIAPYAYIRTKVAENTFVKHVSHTFPVDYSQLPFYPTYVLYCKQTEFTKNLFKRIEEIFIINRIESFNTEDELLNFFKEHKDITFAIIFHGLIGDEIPNKLSYTIRHFQYQRTWMTHKNFETDFQEYSPDKGSEMYFKSGFLALQSAIDSSYIALRNDSDTKIALKFQEFPFPPHFKGMSNQISFLSTAFLMLVVLTSFEVEHCLSLVHIAVEKYSGIQEHLKKMGVSSVVIWFTWFIDIFMFNIYSVIVICVLLKVHFNTHDSSLQYSNIYIFAILMYLYCFSHIAIIFVLLTLVHNPRRVIIFIFVVTYVGLILPLLSVLFDRHKRIPKTVQTMFSFLPSIALCNGIRVFVHYELRSIGVQVTNLFKESNVLELGFIFIVLIAQIMLYGILAYYLDSVNPGVHGNGKKWNFFIKFEKALNIKEHVPMYLSNIDLSIKDKEGAFVNITHLYKFYAHTTALFNFGINVYRNEITVLLGHTGAGKSTLINIICGIVKPSSGSVRINGINVITNQKLTRKYIGFSSQESLLFPGLTVLQHLQFYAKLQNIKISKDELYDLLKIFELVDNSEERPNQLPDGTKRKLCMATACIGKPQLQLLIIDEPTSGLNKRERREILELIKRLRSLLGCSMLVSTSLIEEAIFLGDSIAIMDNGVLLAYGTLAFLNKKFNTEYVLKIEKSDNTSSNYDIIRIVTVIIPNSETVFSGVRELIFVLPNEKKDIRKLVDYLEKNKRNLHINDISLSISSLEDAYLRMSEQMYSKTLDKQSQMITPEKHDVVKIYPLYKSWVLLHNHYLFRKKEWYNYVLLVLVGLFIIFTSAFLSKPKDLSSKMNVGLALTLDVYGKTIVFLSVRKPQNVLLKKLAQEYEKNVIQVGSTLKIVPDIEKAVMNLYNNSPEDYFTRAIVGADFSFTDSPAITVMHANMALHAAPISYNLVTNAFAKVFAGETSAIEIENVPLPLDRSGYLDLAFNVAVYWGFLFAIGMLFIFTCCIIYPHRNHQYQIDHLIYIAGIRKIHYWFTILIFDYASYLVTTALILVAIYLSFNPFFNKYSEFVHVFWILLEMGIVGIPHAYLLCYRSSLVSAFTYLAIMNFLQGFVFILLVAHLIYSNNESYIRAGEILHAIFYYAPQYWFTYTMLNYTTKAVENYRWKTMSLNQTVQFCKYKKLPCCANLSSVECKAYQQYGIQSHKILIIAVVFFTILLIIDSHIPTKISNIGMNMLYGKLYCDPVHHKLDDKVGIFGISRRTKKGIALRNISVNIKRNTCFGMLGGDGSGNTSLIKILTAYLPPTSGVVTLTHDGRVLEIGRNTRRYLNLVGYCPQINALHNTFTGRETLTFFARLRGNKDYKMTVERLLNRLELSKKADTECGKYTLADKRMLCVGIALISDPIVLILDKPTKGVAPGARSKLFMFLRNYKEIGDRVIIFTTDKIEDCENLCDSLAILRRGKFVCCDELRKLKKEHGKGYMLRIKIKSSEDRNDADIVETHFVKTCKSDLQAILKDKSLNVLAYQISYEISISTIFDKMKQLKTASNLIDDYFISEITLEDVFLRNIDD